MRTACYFPTAKGLVGLCGEDHEVLLKVVQRIARDRACRDILSEDFVYEQAVRWLQNRLDDPKVASPSFTDLLKKEASRSVCQVQIWRFIRGVQIAKPFHIGSTAFRPVTREILDAWKQSLSDRSYPAGEDYLARYESSLQGTTAACVDVTAEPARAEEIALQDSDVSIAIFRLASPIILMPHLWAPLDAIGSDGEHPSLVVHVKDSRMEIGSEALPRGMSNPWALSAESIDKHLESVWGSGTELILHGRSDFEKTLLGALVNYSKSILKSDVGEKLLYVMTALESLLTNNPAEGIARNLGERMALLVGSTSEERKGIFDAVVDAYDLRSGFVHEATTISDLSTLQAFLLYAWKTMTSMLESRARWEDKAEVIASLDQHKLSGPPFPA
jgi:hypothetical protein